MEQLSYNYNLELIHAFGSTSSLDYSQAIAISQDEDEHKILFPAGKTLAKKFVDRPEMDFVHFDNSAEDVEYVYILPAKTHVATSEKVFGSNLRVIRIYSILSRDNSTPQTIKVFNAKDSYGTIKSLVFASSEPQFMCCLVSQPYNKLLFIDVSKNKSLAESNFTVKDVEKITISPKNSHLVCATGGSSIRLFRVEEHAFKAIEEIKKLPKGRKYLNHVWYKDKLILVVTDRCEVLIIEEVKAGHYELKQEYSNAFNQANPEQIRITAICPFSKGFILGSSNGKFCLWIRKQQQRSSYQDEKQLQLVRKWSTTPERAAAVTGIAISSKEDMIAICLANNDIATVLLNDIIPQLHEIEMDLFQVKEKQRKQIFFEYLYKGFHNNLITGMDVCMQRPLLATCSHEDNTIRIWNYKNFGCRLLRMFYFRVQDQDQENKPLITLTFHPNGYYIAVGCSDKVRFFFVLSNQLRPYREIAIKGAHIVKFSKGGHLLATASPMFDQEASTQPNHRESQAIHVFNAITLEEIISFETHKSRITTLQWKKYDEYLCSVSRNGQLVEWRTCDWKESRQTYHPSYKYQLSKYFHERNELIVFATKQIEQNSVITVKKYIHRYELNPINSHSINAPFEQYEVDMKITSMGEICINRRSVLILGLENGSLILLSILERNGKAKLQTLGMKSEHLRSVTQINLSPCHRYLMTSGQDCMIFIYRAELMVNGSVQEDDSGLNVVDDFLADVVLYPKNQMVKHMEKEKEYEKVLGTLGRKLELASNQANKQHEQKMKALQSQKNHVIENLIYRIKRIEDQINNIISKNDNSLMELDARNCNEVDEIKMKYEDKIQFEKEKYFQMEQEIIQEDILHKERVQQLHVQMKGQIDAVQEQFASKFRDSQKVYVKSKATVSESTDLFEQRIIEVESEQEQELRELQERLQQFRIEKATAEEEFHHKLTKVRKDHQKFKQERDEVKLTFQELTYRHKKINKEIEQAKQKLKEMKLENTEKLDILKHKQAKTVEFDSKINDLQKKKHILSYKVTEMKKALEPKQMQIDKLKSDLIKLKREFEVSLDRKQKLILHIEKIEKEKMNMEKELQDSTAALTSSSNYLDQIIYDIYTCKDSHEGNLLDSSGNSNKLYLKELVKLYHKHVEKVHRKPQSYDPKGVEEMTKQIVHLEKSLFQVNQSNQKNAVRKNDEINKRIKENAELISNLNGIKKENEELARKIKCKNYQIANLKVAKSEILSRLKKVDENLYNRSQREDHGPTDTLNTSSNLLASSFKKQDKLALLQDSRDSRSQVISSMKKKQNELISEAEFLNEKIHKVDYFLKQIKMNIRQHQLHFKCDNKEFLEQELSEIN